jgi:hypothetical protein
VTPQELLAHLHRLDVRVVSDGGKLRLSAPEGVLTPGLRELIAGHKAELLAFIEATEARARGNHTALIPLQAAGTRPPFFAMPGHNGDVFCYVHLAKCLGPDQPFYALQPPGLEGSAEPVTSVPELASLYADELCSFQPRGPFLLGGYCLGGTIAFETARQLTARGREVAQLVLFGSPCPTALKPSGRGPAAEFAVRRIRQVRSLWGRPFVEWVPFVWTRLRDRWRRHPEDGPPPDETARRRIAVEGATLNAVRNYDLPPPFAGPVTLLVPSEEWIRSEDRPLDWQHLVEGKLELLIGPPGNNGDIMLWEPYVRWTADRLTGLIDRTAPTPRLAAASQ